MNTLKVLSRYAFIIMALFLTACSEDDESTDGGDDADGATGTEFVTAKIDGADYAAAQDPVVIVGATIDSGVFAVQGGTNDGETIRITINNYEGPGTYVTGDDLSNASSLMYVTLTPVATWMNGGVTALVDGVGTGTIEVTSDADGVVEGTFSFKGYNADDMTIKEITNGKFKALID